MVIFGAVIAVASLFLVLNWWSEGMVEASDAIIIVCVLGGSAIGLFTSSTVPQRLFALLPMLGIIGYVAYSFKAGGNRNIYRKRCEEYVGAIHNDPRNYGARQMLAETLYKMGEIDRAIDEMQVAVDMGAGMECSYELAKWKKERTVRDTVNPYCKWCAIDYPKGTRVCSTCGSRLSYQSPFARWLAGGSYPGIRYYLILLLGVALLGVSMMLRPIHYALIPAALLLLAIIGWSFVTSARS